jgi:hypothetical protein
MLVQFVSTQYNSADGALDSLLYGDRVASCGGLLCCRFALSAFAPVPLRIILGGLGGLDSQPTASP